MDEVPRTRTSWWHREGQTRMLIKRKWSCAWCPRIALNSRMTRGFQIPDNPIFSQEISCASLNEEIQGTRLAGLTKLPNICPWMGWKVTSIIITIETKELSKLQHCCSRKGEFIQQKKSELDEKFSRTFYKPKNMVSWRKIEVFCQVLQRYNFEWIQFRVCDAA